MCTVFEKMTEKELKRILLIYSPPTLLFEYHVKRKNENGHLEEKIRNKMIQLNVNLLFKKNFDILLAVTQLKKQFPRFFPGKIETKLDDKMKKFLEKILISNTSANEIKQEIGNFVFQRNINLNKISEEENLKRAKKSMQFSFDLNRIKPDSNRYEYDVRADFDMVSENSWDDKNEVEDNK